MQTISRVIRGFEIPTPSEVWELVKGWAERRLAPERKIEVALTVGTLVLIGYVAFVVQRGL